MPDQPTKPAPAPTTTIRLGLDVFGFWLFAIALVLRPALVPATTPAGPDVPPPAPVQPDKPAPIDPGPKPASEVTARTRDFLQAVGSAYETMAGEVAQGTLARATAPARLRDLVKPADTALSKAVGDAPDYGQALRDEGQVFRRAATPSQGVAGLPVFKGR